MDWTSKEIRHSLIAEMVKPNGYTHLGWLDVENGTVTYQYYSDERVYGKVSTYTMDEYIDLAMLRLVHIAELGKEIYREPLGTFFAEVSSDEYTESVHKGSFNLNSVLWGMADDLAPNETSLAEGGFAKDAMQQICEKCSRPFKIESNFNDYRFGSNHILEALDSYLSHLHQIADLSGNRVDCDELGNVSFSKYIAPSEKEPTISLEYGSSMILTQPISMDNGDSDTYSRAIVTWEHSDDDTNESMVITGYADVESGNRLHIANRGYRKSVAYREDDLGTSIVEAQNKAREYLEYDSVGTVTWELQTKYFPLSVGDVIKWRPRDGAERYCMVTSLEKQLSGSFSMDIIMKEI